MSKSLGNVVDPNEVINGTKEVSWDGMSLGEMSWDGSNGKVKFVVNRYLISKVV